MTRSLLGSYEMAIPAAVYGVLMYLFGAALTLYGRRFVTAAP